MIQVFDTHRLSYRNAKLRAFALSDQTRRLDFYNIGEDGQETNIGNEVVTNDAGYLFYGTGTQKVSCLSVPEAAIVKVALDGDDFSQIQWLIHPDYDPAALHNAGTLSFMDANGITRTYNPADHTDMELPDYALRSQVQGGQWAEEEVIIVADDSVIPISTWTKVVGITADAPDTLVLGGPPRAGQVIFILPFKNCTLNAGTGNTHNLTQDKAYLLVKFNGTPSLPLVVELG